SPANDEDEVIALTVDLDDPRLSSPTGRLRKGNRHAEEENGDVVDENTVQDGKGENIIADEDEEDDDDEPAISGYPRPGPRSMQGSAPSVSKPTVYVLLQKRKLTSVAGEDEDELAVSPSEDEGGIGTIGRRERLSSDGARVGEEACIYAAILWSYIGFTIRQASRWGEDSCCCLRVLYMATYDWERVNYFIGGAQVPPGLTEEMKANVTLLRFPRAVRARRSGEKSFTLCVMDCFAQLRLAAFSKVQHMHGQYGLSAVVRAIVDARYFDEQFGPYFIPLVKELTLLLEGLTQAADVTDNEREFSGTVYEFLASRAPSLASQNTKAIQHYVDRVGEADGGGKKRKASAGQVVETSRKKSRGLSISEEA
ncbi:hypothetical protein PENSPDRAFT_691174, partial [Peniophora sp. CONT]